MNDQKRREIWEKWRAKGIVRFILELGILRFGLPLAAVNRIIDYVVTHGFTTSRLGELATARNLIAFLIFMLVSGALFGAILWFYANYKMSNLAR